MKHFSKRFSIVFSLSLISAVASADCVGLMCSSYDYTVPVNIANTTPATPALTVTGGYAGIGTVTPQATLHVAGGPGSTIRISDGSQGAGKVLTSDVNGSATWMPAGSSQWVTTGTTIAYMAGFVGIGMTNPGAAPLQVAGTILSNGFNEPGQLIVRSAGGSISSPTFLNSGSGAGNISFRGYDGSGYRRLGAIRVLSADPSGVSGTSSAGHMSFSTTPIGAITEAEKMRLTQDGKLGIGTTSPTEMLEVAGKVKATEFCIGSACLSAWPPFSGHEVEQLKIENHKLTQKLKTLEQRLEKLENR